MIRLNGSMPNFVNYTRDGSFLYKLLESLRINRGHIQLPLRSPMNNGLFDTNLALDIVVDFLEQCNFCEHVNFTGSDIKNGACSMQLKDLLSHLWVHRDKFNVAGIFYDRSLVFRAAEEPQLLQIVHTMRKRVMNNLKAIELLAERNLPRPFRRLFYNYIVLNTSALDENCTFLEFIKASVYIGKGTGGRLFFHVKEAVKHVDCCRF